MDRAKPIMVQGTASNVGKSILAAALCRILRQDGYSVAPFKSQNMALNSFITKEGLEMGRAQVTQAEAAGVEPSVLMNPVLLKPTGDSKSQVIVEGEVWANLTAAEYYSRKAELRPMIQRAYDTLAERYDTVVIEGAGSPAEINLKRDDFVNMGMAAMADAPVVLVGDIDRGGVFASLYGTLLLLEEEERRRVKGVIINKFRGDVEILRPGLAQLEALCGVPVLGVVPWTALDIDDEDSLSSRLTAGRGGKAVDIAVVHLPHISNFTDFTALSQHPALGVRYVREHRALGRPDLIILPGTKNTMADLLWLRQSGLEGAVRKLAAGGTPVIGICGGYQMLGLTLSDPEGVEQGGELAGMGLLPIHTEFCVQKERTRVSGAVRSLEGFFAPLSDAAFEGYEIHMGRTELEEGTTPFSDLKESGAVKEDGAVSGHIMGSYVHGLFDSGALPRRLAELLLERKGMAAEDAEQFDYAAHKERQFDLLADTVRAALDMDAVYEIMGLST